MKNKYSKKITVISAVILFSILGYSNTYAEDATTTSTVITATTTEVVPPVDTSTSTPPDTSTTTPPVVVPPVVTPVVPPIVTPPSVVPPVVTTPPDTKTYDTAPPSNISDLIVEGLGSKSLTVSWTVPQDDSGKIAGYEVRLAKSPLNESNWDEAITFPGSPSNSTSGGTDKMEFGSLPEDTTVYIALKAYDASGNKSGISNLAQATTKSRVFTLDEIRAQSRGTPNPQGVDANSISNAVSSLVSADPTVTFGTVKLVIKTPDGLPIPFPVYVNFINSSTGLSYGGPTINGLASYKIPVGDYYAKMIILDNNFKEPLAPITFSLAADENKDLGTATLQAMGSQDDTALLLKSTETTGGIAKMLVLIVKLLGEILSTLQKVAIKLNV